MLTLLSRYVVYPVVELRDPHRRLASLRALQRTQWLSSDHLRQRQEAQLRRILEYAGAHCVFYRARFAECGLNPAAADVRAELAKLPILTKDDIRERTPDLVSDKFP